MMMFFRVLCLDVFVENTYRRTNFFQKGMRKVFSDVSTSNSSLAETKNF